MSNRIHLLAQQLTGKASVDECSLEEVHHIAKRYPYYAPAQFLLFQKLKSTSAPATEEQQNKAVLYYHDPLLFDYFISSDRFHVEETSLFRDNSVPDSLVTEPLQEKAHYIAEEKIHSETDSLPATETVTQLQSDESISSTEANSVLDEEVVAPTQVFHSVSSEKEDEEGAAALQHGSLETITSSLHTETKAVNATDELTFEPYHTVDYFASQGIKISQEEPKDKLGKQLKSFTEWLKTMKRLPSVAQTGVAVEASAEKKIETMANHSVSESDVVTEAMAEVWAKQGNREKAEETYNKLSLLNPSKRAYFAAKIDNLKQS